MDEHALLQQFPAFRGRPCVVRPLDGGLTNRNFRVEVDGESYVLRLAGQDTGLLGIDRNCELACARAAAAAGIAPEVTAAQPELGVLVRRFARGRVLGEEDVRQPAVLHRVTQALRRYHDGPGGGGSFSSFETVRRYHRLALERGVKFPEQLAAALERMVHLEVELRSDESPCPCHNDLLAANFIDDGVTVQIIDWEYAGQGDRYFDLGNLAVNCGFGAEEERSLLRHYFGEVRPGALRRLRLMRLMSDLREAFWGYLQVALSSLEVDYSAYGRRHLDRFLAAPWPMESAG